jgi:lysyl-tRNA synthetase class 1
MYQKPKTAKRLHFDIIPKMVDEYHQQLRAYPEQDIKTKLSNPVWHIHGNDVPASGMAISFSMLLNLASVAGAEEKETLWGFIKRYQSEATPETHIDLDQAVGFAVAFYNDFVKPNKVYREASELEREAIVDLRDKLRNYGGDLDAESLQSLVFSCGRDRFDPLRSWFQALYEILLGASQGPRFGGFILLYGIEETIDLIDAALAGEFL